MRLAVAQILRDHDLEDDYYARNELEQQARIFVITYAGLMPGWQSGKLAEWTKRAGGDEKQIRLLMANQLKLALSQVLCRQSDSRVISLDEILESGLEPVERDTEDQAERTADQLEAARYRELYPTLALNVFDGLTQAEIAAADGVTRRAVEYRIAKEKRAFLMAYLARRGLAVEGGETIEELTEAYGYFTDGRLSFSEMSA